jgi:hypothetical protein
MLIDEHPPPHARARTWPMADCTECVIGRPAAGSGQTWWLIRPGVLWSPARARVFLNSR